MIFIDLAERSIIECGEPWFNGKRNVLLLNPAEYFIYQTSKKEKISPEEICDVLNYADNYVYYSRLGKLIAYFFSNFDDLFVDMDYCFFKEMFLSNIVKKVPFSDYELNAIGDILYSCFNDIDGLIIDEAKSEERLARQRYSINDIKNLLFDRFNVELDCGETDEELYNKYVDKDKHSLIKGAEKVIFNSNISFDKFIADNFDLRSIRDRIHNL